MYQKKNVDVTFFPYIYKKKNWIDFLHRKLAMRISQKI